MIDEDRRRPATAGPNGPVIRRWRASRRLATLGVLGTLAAARLAAAPAGAIDQLAWLAGCWAHEEGGQVTEEQWMRPLGGAMLGNGRTVVAGRIVGWERLRIDEQDGRLVYTALPSGQQEASFDAVEIADGLAVFANPDHDFPQRIRYHRLPDGSLLAQTEGERDGATRVVDFPFQRIRCEVDAGPVGTASDGGD